MIKVLFTYRWLTAAVTLFWEWSYVVLVVTGPIQSLRFENGFNICCYS